MIESLHESIERIKDVDFAGQWKTDIYLDPERQVVYPFTDTGGIPMDAYHKIDQLILTVSPGAIADSVHAYLSDIEDDLETLIGEYLGSEWNGSNHIGQWKVDEDGYNTLDYILRGEAPPQIAYYWDAGEWFSPVMSDLKRSWEEGKTAEEIIDEQGCGDSVDGMCDRDEAIAWLEQQIEEWKAETEEDNQEAIA